LAGRVTHTQRVWFFFFQMIQRSTRLLAAEFKQKSRWTYVRPQMHYGAMFLPFGVGRKLPLTGCVWVTRDSNRLSNFSVRYQSVIAELDASKNEAELNVPPTDVRWADHRRLNFRCQTCGESYRKAVSSIMKFHAGCNACKKRFPSEVLKEQLPGTALSSTRPQLVKQLAGDKTENVATFAATSKYEAKWSCMQCKKEYRAPIRQRTGLVEPGQAPVHPLSPQWTDSCPDCRWEKNLANVGRQALQQLDFLGLDASLKEIASTSTKKIPRRSKLLFT
jgi:hypothetical protein